MNRTTEPIFLVAASEPQDLMLFRLDGQSGAMQMLCRAGFPSPTPPEPAGLPLALSPDRRFVHGVLRQEPHPIVSFAIGLDPPSLTPIGGSNIARRPAQMAVHETGRYLFTASYAAHGVSVGPIGPDGAALPATQIFDTPPQTHGVLVAPGGRHVYAASMAGDVVVGFHFDPATGRIDEVPFVRCASAPGAGPRHMVVDASGRHLYALTEHHATVMVFDRDPVTGGLVQTQCVSMLPETLFEESFTPAARPPPGAADLRLTRDGTMLFTSDRVTDTVAAFAVDTRTGRLSPLASNRVRPTPRSIAVTADGSHLVSLGVWEGTVNVYGVATDGQLTERSSVKVAQTVDWVEGLW